MPISKDHLVDVLRVRYDAYSAEAVFTQACVRAGLDGTTSFDQRALMSFREGLNQVGDRVGGVLARIDALLENASPAAKTDAMADDSRCRREPRWRRIVSTRDQATRPDNLAEQGSLAIS